MQKDRVILAPKLARMLLRQGYRIIDIEPNKNFPERTVFIFEDAPGLSKLIEYYQKS
jgi:predicted CoA-binding protein